MGKPTNKALLSQSGQNLFLSMPVDALPASAIHVDALPDGSLNNLPAETAQAPHLSGNADIPSLIKQLRHPSELAGMSVESLEKLASEIRAILIDSVSKTGGHLAPSLGVVDLTVAMLSVFNPAEDKILWDVGHQAYAYKLLTGRADKIGTLRQLDGLSGFPTPDESPYDHFGVGHSSTSISAALGMAVARDLAGKKHHVVSVIGDGSLTAGLAYEGFNQAGSKDRPFIVILNDNEMSISKNVGALSLFMSRNLSSRWIRRVKKEVEVFLKNVPGIGDDLYEIAKRSKHSFKNFFTPGILFEALRFNYIGAVDGHNITELQKVLKLAASLDEPVLVHVLTQKGHGYKPAEKNPEKFHGVSKFDPSTGESAAASCEVVTHTYTEVFGETLCKLAQEDERIVAITAAMPSGTGLVKFSEEFPQRFFDVGIAEQHAVTFAAGLAAQGLRPFVAIYSTFLQRAYDQVIHDVCLQRLPVTFCLDRAGLVGEDGATHQGAFDISYLRHIPELTVFAPGSAGDLQRGLVTALQHNAPFALRYPKGISTGDLIKGPLLPFSVGESEFLLKNTGGVAVIAIGSCVATAYEACSELIAEGYQLSLLNSRFIKPLPTKALKEIAETYDKILIVEEQSLAGGFSSAVIEFFVDNNLMRGQQIKRTGFPDKFIKHGSIKQLKEIIGLDKAALKDEIIRLL